MSVMGFDDVYRHSTTIRLSSSPPLEVKIPTLPGLAILKLLSWKNNYPERKKDARDLLFIMINYEHAGIFDFNYLRMRILTLEQQVLNYWEKT